MSKEKEFNLAEFAERLKKVIINDFGSIRKFAEILGEPPSYISNYTSGAREPRANFFWKLAQYNININYLLTGETLMERAEIEVWIEKLKQIENELKEVKAKAFDLSEENKELKNKISDLEKENFDLRVQTFGINKVAERAEKYSLKRGKKNK